MNEKISSLFDSEINNTEVDTLLSKKNKMAGVRSSMSDYQIIPGQPAHHIDLLS